MAGLDIVSAVFTFPVVMIETIIILIFSKWSYFFFLFSLFFFFAGPFQCTQGVYVFFTVALTI